MKTKKILSGLLAASMALAMSTTAFAGSITTNNGTGETVLTYGMGQSFVVTIPADFIIDGQTNKATAEVTASNVMIGDGKVLEVVISGNDYTDKWELIDKAESTNTLEYTIGTTEGGNNIVSGSVVLDVAAGEAYNSTVEEVMHFTVVDTLSKAGEYDDTLTFTVDVN